MISSQKDKVARITVTYYDYDNANFIKHDSGHWRDFRQEMKQIF